jgi:hypothetical protein
MEPFQQKFQTAKKKIYVADHMLSTTYSLLKDTKILLAILENVHYAYENALSALLEHERLFKRIPSYNDTVMSRKNIFKMKIQKTYDFDLMHANIMDKLASILQKHKDSPVEFSKDNKYIIASDSYDLTKISPEDLKTDIKSCKEFIAQVEKVIADA